MKRSPEDAALIAAVNKRVARGRRVGGGETAKPTFTPPRCSRPGCLNVADVNERDFTGTRPYFCTDPECFQAVREYVSSSGQSSSAVPNLTFMPRKTGKS